MGEIIFEKVGERDIDLLIMRAFSSTPQFKQMFFKQLGWDNCKIIHIEHSLMHTELGETDVIVIAQKDDRKYCLLIENKIDAEAQPEQYSRYVQRGELGVSTGQYDCFAVFITAPQIYLDTDPEAKKYPYHLSYETMLSFFENRDDEFECSLLRAAIQKKEDGYTVLEVPAITKFWEDLHQYIQSGSYAIDMNKPAGAKGSRSTWVPFRTPLSGTYLYFKSRYGFVDLEFSGKRREVARLKNELMGYLEDGMQWEETGASLSLRIRVKPIDFKIPFEQSLKETELMLLAVEKMTKFAVKLSNMGFVV